jgi:hypothetical protein
MEACGQRTRDVALGAKSAFRRAAELMCSLAAFQLIPTTEVWTRRCIRRIMRLLARRIERAKGAS